MDQSTLVTRVANRLNIDSNDPLYASLDEFVNEGIHYLETSSPEGYGWMRQTVTLTTTASTASYTFAVLGALPATDITVMKVLDASILYQSDVWEPLDLINPETAILSYGDTNTGFPEAWFVEGSTFYLYPTPNAAYSVRVRVVAMEPDLGGGGSTPVMPVVFHQAIIDAACLVAYQQLQDVNRMDIMERKVEKHIERMKRYGSQYAAAPRITVRDPLVI